MHTLMAHKIGSSAHISLACIYQYEALRKHYGSNTILLRKHYESNTNPTRYYYGSTTNPTRIQYGTTTKALRNHVFDLRQIRRPLRTSFPHDEDKDDDLKPCVDNTGDDDDDDDDGPLAEDSE